MSGIRGNVDIFQSTPSAWRETDGHVMHCPFCGISIHSLRMEGDPAAIYVHHRKAISIHALRMEGDRFNTSCAARCSNFNPLPPHGGRLHCCCRRNRLDTISIHSLRMEGDLQLFRRQPELCISIHSLRMEGDNDHCSAISITNHFNPLPPHGGRPGIRCLLTLLGKYFNPLPPHGGRRNSQTFGEWLEKFQSTPSAWRETV